MLSIFACGAIMVALTTRPWVRKPEQLSGLPKVQLIILPIERKVIDAVAVAYALLELVPLLTADRRKGLARDGQKLREQLDNDLNYQEKSVV